MARTLQPQDRIAHYQVVGALAAGGMGEVYLAKDETLERSVALKVLPAGLVRNEERVRRFVTEAKSASSLSHPHIVTIYEIGQDRVRSGSGEEDPASDLVHYISMELVTGETLKDKIHHEGTDLRTLLGYLVQAAEGLAKAHASGIVHRDLKPGNIMISRDGYAKVLDFGLAKLTERETASADATSAATELADGTGEGVVLGTVGYMSPEQVRARTVDHRSDIFSFGCVLYEAATRRRPFAADSDVETMHQILNQHPDAVEEIAPETPNALRRLIRRCLAKNPDQRLQSMKDLAIELQEIVDEYDTLTPSGSSSTIPSPEAARRGPSRAGLLGIAGSLVGLIAVVWAMTRGTDRSEPPPAARAFETMSMTTLVSAEAIDSPVLSADGRYLAYVGGSPAERSLWVRQVATGSQVRVAGPVPSLGNASFSPDGNYVFFGMRDPETPNYTAIFSVPSLGGTPRKRLFDVDSRISHHPDGSWVCFRRGRPQVNQDDIVLANLETGEERVLDSAPNQPGVQGVEWSPDGASIACLIFRFAGGFRAELRIYDVETGESHDVGDLPGMFVNEIAWLPDGESLAAIVSPPAGWSEDLWLIPVNGGKARRVTNDLNGYSDLSVGENGRALAAVRDTRTTNIWIAPADGSAAARPLTRGGELIHSLRPLSNDRFLFVKETSGGSRIWTSASGGSEPRPLSQKVGLNFDLATAPQWAVFGRADESLVPHVWSLDPDDGGEFQVTHGTGEIVQGLSPDGGTVLFSPTEKFGSVWAVSTRGGDPQLLLPEAGTSFSNSVHFSPDGRWIAYADLLEAEGRWVPHTEIVPATGGDPVATFRHPPRAGNLQWTPDSKGFTFRRVEEGVHNIYRMTRDHPDPVRVTSFQKGLIRHHDWSPDGSRMLVMRRIDDEVSVWIVPGDGEPYSVAAFPTGEIFESRWLSDGESIAFLYGRETRDVVLLRDFQ